MDLQANGGHEWCPSHYQDWKCRTSGQESQSEINPMLDGSTTDKMTNMMLGTFSNGTGVNAAPYGYTMAGKLVRQRPALTRTSGALRAPATASVVISQWLGFPTTGWSHYLTDSSAGTASEIFRTSQQCPALYRRRTLSLTRWRTPCWKWYCTVGEETTKQIAKTEVSWGCQREGIEYGRWCEKSNRRGRYPRKKRKTLWDTFKGWLGFYQKRFRNSSGIVLQIEDNALETFLSEHGCQRTSRRSSWLKFWICLNFPSAKTQVSVALFLTAKSFCWKWS